ncbi:MAG: hypothetical protein HFH86_00530 [Bacilli bacterium]|nr:hypothetical protein [Bacilli bacterium]
MNKFILESEKKKMKCKKVLNNLNGLRMHPHFKNKPALISIKEIIIIREDLKKIIIIKRFNKTYRSLISIVLDVTSSDNATSSDCMIALNEVRKLGNILDQKYQCDLEKKEYDKLQKKLEILQTKLKEKLVEIRTNILLEQMKEMQEKEKGKSR